MFHDLPSFEVRKLTTNVFLIINLNLRGDMIKYQVFLASGITCGYLRTTERFGYSVDYFQEWDCKFRNNYHDYLPNYNCYCQYNYGLFFI